MQKKKSKVSMCDSLPSQLPTMTFNNIEIKRENSIKFLGVIIDENLTWKNHIEVVENKISKNIGVLYRASHLLDFKNLKIYFSFIHIYISYANIAWASTFKTKLQGILKKQKTCCTNITPWMSSSPAIFVEIKSYLFYFRKP